MSTNKIDKQIADKLKDRTLESSTSAWERLSSQLDEHETKKNKKWFLYIGYAVGIALLFSVGFSYFGTKKTKEPIEVITNIPLDTLQFDAPKLKELILIEEAIVKKEKGEKKGKRGEDRVKRKEEKQQEIKHKIIISTKENKAKLERVAIAKVGEMETQIKSLEKSSNSRIKVNSDDLLYAVTHTPAEVEAYYAKYNVKREDVLKTIKIELKKSNLKINPNIILAEVERSIDDDLFQNNFMQKLKLKISDIAVAIADRNK